MPGSRVNLNLPKRAGRPFFNTSVAKSMGPCFCNCCFCLFNEFFSAPLKTFCFSQNISSSFGVLGSAFNSRHRIGVTSSELRVTRFFSLYLATRNSKFEIRNYLYGNCFFIIFKPLFDNNVSRLLFIFVLPDSRALK